MVLQLEWGLWMVLCSHPILIFIVLVFIIFGYFWSENFRAQTYWTVDVRSNLNSASVTISPWLIVTAPVASSWNDSNLQVNLTCSIWISVLAVSATLSKVHQLISLAHKDRLEKGVKYGISLGNIKGIEHYIWYFPTFTKTSQVINQANHIRKIKV